MQCTRVLVLDLRIRFQAAHRSAERLCREKKEAVCLRKTSSRIDCRCEGMRDD